MHRTRRNVVTAAASLVAAGTFLRRAHAAPELKYKLSVNVPDTHPLTLRLIEAAKEIAERSNGQLAVTVFPNSQLGGDSETLSQVRSGVLELLAVPSMTLSILVPLSGLPSVGYAFRSYDQIWPALDGAVGDHVRDAIRKTGLVPMKNAWDNGFRQITSADRPINTVDDFKGFKVRVPLTALLTSLFSGLGASPTSISFNELYSALQTKVVDGQENPLSLIDTAKFYEVQKYCTLSSHCWSGYWVVGNARALNALSAPLREIMENAFNAAALKERTDLAATDRKLQASLASKGMVFNTPDPASFKAALQKNEFYAQWQKKYGADAWASLERYTGALA